MEQKTDKQTRTGQVCATKQPSAMHALGDAWGTSGDIGGSADATQWSAQNASPAIAQGSSEQHLALVEQGRSRPQCRCHPQPPAAQPALLLPALLPQLPHHYYHCHHHCHHHCHCHQQQRCRQRSRRSCRSAAVAPPQPLQRKRFLPLRCGRAWRRQAQPRCAAQQSSLATAARLARQRAPEHTAACSQQDSVEGHTYQQQQQ